MLPHISSLHTHNSYTPLLTLTTQSPTLTGHQPPHSPTKQQAQPPQKLPHAQPTLSSTTHPHPHAEQQRKAKTLQATTPPPPQNCQLCSEHTHSTHTHTATTPKRLVTITRCITQLVRSTRHTQLCHPIVALQQEKTVEGISSTVREAVALQVGYIELSFYHMLQLFLYAECTQTYAQGSTHCLLLYAQYTQLRHTHTHTAHIHTGSDTDASSRRSWGGSVSDMH